MSNVPILAGRYRLERKVAQGGMGEIYDGRDLQLERRVAVKLIRDGFSADPTARGRFFREAKAAAAIASPHVVQTLDFGVDGTTLFIVMEWLDGEDLGQLIKREGPREPQEMAEILRQLARGVRKAHEQRIVHRDLKPANLFLARVDGDRMVKILDFGIAKGPSMVGETRTGTVVGSIPYMSPEQARATRELDPRSDLWSVAVILFVSLTGAYPFAAASETDMLIRICTEPSQPPSELRPRLGSSFDAFFAHAFLKDPARRFQTIDELVEAFLGAVGGTWASHPVPSSSVRSFRTTQPLEPPRDADAPKDLGLAPPTAGSYARAVKAAGTKPRIPAGLLLGGIGFAAVLGVVLLLAIRWRVSNGAATEDASRAPSALEASAASAATEWRPSVEARAVELETSRAVSGAVDVTPVQGSSGVDAQASSAAQGAASSTPTAGVSGSAQGRTRPTTHGPRPPPPPPPATTTTRPRCAGLDCYQ